MKETAFNLHRPLHQEGFQNRTPSHNETLCFVVQSACGHARDKPELYLHCPYFSGRIKDFKCCTVFNGLHGV